MARYSAVGTEVRASVDRAFSLISLASCRRTIHGATRAKGKRSLKPAVREGAWGGERTHGRSWPRVFFVSASGRGGADAKVALRGEKRSTRSNATIRRCGGSHQDLVLRARRASRGTERAPRGRSARCPRTYPDPKPLDWRNAWAIAHRLPKIGPTPLVSCGLTGTGGDSIVTGFAQAFAMLTCKTAHRLKVSSTCSAGFESRPLR
jgi:hypothetical protein